MSGRKDVMKTTKSEEMRNRKVRGGKNETKWWVSKIQK